MLSFNILPLASLIGLSLALPKARSPNLDPNPIPGESPLFATYTGKPTPIPANYTRVIPATSSGPAGPDDVLFQNLLSAEWIIYSFYQQGVEAFTPSSFSDLGYPNSTYDRIAEIRDNEAGHIRIFQDEISSTSLKPGPCNYSFGFNNDPETFLALQVYIEVNSMAFLTGLVREANTTDTRSALVAIGEIETRHNAWSLIDIWDVSPFSGPADTVYPYANQILALTNSFVVSGSCPSENPQYPYPNQNLPEIGYVTNTTTGHPGSKIQLEFSSDPAFVEGGDYYAVFFHGLQNISVPFDISTNETVIPGSFDKGAGIVAIAIADEAGAPTEDSVLAGPLLLLQQPEKLTVLEP